MILMRFIHPEKVAKFKDNWNSVRPYLINRFKNCTKMQDLDDKVLVSLLSTLLPSTYKIFLIFGKISNTII